MYDVNAIDKELQEINNNDTPYYGQWETDKIIASYFNSTIKGTCIEVGAANGIKGSNTKYFEDMGWGALCIEPNLKHRESLESSRNLVRFFACGDQIQKKLYIYLMWEGIIYFRLSLL